MPWPSIYSAIWVSVRISTESYCSQLNSQGLSVDWAPGIGFSIVCLITNFFLQWKTLSQAQAFNSSCQFIDGSSPSWKDHSFSPGPGYVSVPPCCFQLDLYFKVRLTFQVWHSYSLKKKNPSLWVQDSSSEPIPNSSLQSHQCWGLFLLDSP